jgi:DNA polymerase III subunit delta'
MWNTIGFESQREYFEQLLQRNSLAHAYLFSGSDMIGKKKFAADLYRVANKNSMSDLLVVAPRVSEGEAKIYVDDVREIITFLSRKPLPGPYKFVIIDSADQLTIEASNALLKVLEEPSAHSVLLLISSQPRLLLPTIASRCQEIRFLPHESKTIDALLASKRLSKEDRDLITLIADGRLGWAIRTIESDGLSEVRSAIADLQKLMRLGVAERLSFAKKLHEKEAYSPTIEYWLRWTHAQIGKSNAAASVVLSLMRLHYLVSQPQYNHRLALENFLVNL